MEIIKQLNYIFSRKQKIKVVGISITIVIGALLELLGITAILPFVEIAMDPDSIFENKWLSWAYDLLGMSSAKIFLAIVAGLLILIYLVKNIYLTAMNYIIFRFTYTNQRQLAVRLLKVYLKQPYTFFLKNNSADLIRNVSADTSMLFDTVLCTMQLLVEFLVCGLLFIFLLMMDKTITIGVLLILVVFWLVFMKSFKQNIEKRGTIVRDSKGEMSKWLMQAFGGIKESKIMERNQFFLNKYDHYHGLVAEHHSIYQILSYMPKPMMETLCISSILLIVAIKLINGVESGYFISTISVFAVAAFRLLPAFNRIMGYVSRIAFNHSGVNAVYNDLKEVEILEKKYVQNQLAEELSFDNEIRIMGLDFKYPNTEDLVLKDANLVIPKNKSIAFIGPSGAGKTTLADLVLGILEPEKGNILCDDKSIENHMHQWHEKLGYIPQSIYLMDDTIRNNIAFAIEEERIDEKRLLDVLKEAQLIDFVENLPDGLNTIIGEQGVRLSGGQRQRIGIARALYSDPEILVLDEATSALDNDTEAAVMDAIENLAGKKTLIIIAHRLTTIKNCDIVYEVKDGTVKEVSGKV